ncbi:MAG TPA: phosphoribosylformylglycinamidine synthase subunit PurS [Bacillales bacterium]|nr:phosphoribosylformylglycinamidine synthase subunit PurS [Bacillales bacterium]
MSELLNSIMIGLNNNGDKIFLANVSIENKSFLNDPEGETILNDLILKEGYHDIISVRTAKTLIIEILAKNSDDAEIKIKEMCNNLRVYNPIVSECKIVVQKK